MKTILKNKIYFKLNLRMFDVTNATTSTAEGNDLSVEMKTFYSDYLIDTAAPMLVHDQFAQKHPIPKNGGKTIEFRKISPLPKATTQLVEGVTPDGRPLNWSKLTATIAQYGAWVPLTDILDLTAIDNNMVHATQILGDQAGRTLDTVTREVLTVVHPYSIPVEQRLPVTLWIRQTIN
jgi:N4-gp56 family major capsid protein